MAMNILSPRSWLQFLWNSLKAAHTLVFGIFSVLLIIAVFVSISEPGAAKIPDGGALVLNPSGLLVEQKTALEFEALLQGQEKPNETLVKDIIDALALARDDDRIQSLVLRLDELQGGLLPKLQRIANAIADFKTSGKRVVATGMNYNQSSLLLAAQADEVFLNPEGFALPQGFSMHRTYYKTLLENFDVSINLFKVGKYKSAVEPFFRDSMSDEDREARLGIINNWWGAYTQDLEAARALPGSTIDEAMQDIPGLLAESEGNLARISLATGLVDKLVTNDESRAMLVELAGEDEETGDYRGIGFLDYLALASTPEKQKANKIAVITAVGTIVDGHAKAGTIGSRSLSELIRQAYDDEDVKAVVLRVDSGGGSKTASEIIRRELEYIQEDGIPVVASMGSVAASGGYWISATADEIWALPTTVTGSIGIFGVIPTFEKTLARYGINSDGVSTTPLAGGASLERGISPLAAEVIQSVIEAGYREFLAGVARGRDMTTEAVHEIAQGRVWSGEAALELGLVDKLGDLEEAIAAAAALAEVEDYSVWYVEPEQSTRDMLLRELMAHAPVVKSPLSLDPISLVTRQIRQDLKFLSTLNDPQGAYVICGLCPMNP
jgi:protease IV